MTIDDAKNKLLDADDLEITCVISQGKRQGELYKKRVRYGAPSGFERNTTAKTITKEGTFRGGRKLSIHDEDFTIPMTDVEINKYFSPKLSHIIEIEGVKIYR
jgi:hypothetical protein